jgi:hypothetical protein
LAMSSSSMQSGCLRAPESDRRLASWTGRPNTDGMAFTHLASAPAAIAPIVARNTIDVNAYW